MSQPAMAVGRMTYRDIVQLLLKCHSTSLHMLQLCTLGLPSKRIKAGTEEGLVFNMLLSKTQPCLSVVVGLAVGCL